MACWKTCRALLAFKITTIACTIAPSLTCQSMAPSALALDFLQGVEVGWLWTDSPTKDPQDIFGEQRRGRGKIQHRIGSGGVTKDLRLCWPARRLGDGPPLLHEVVNRRLGHRRVGDNDLMP